MVDSIQLEAGDGAKVEAQSKIDFANAGKERVTALLFDLP